MVWLPVCCPMFLWRGAHLKLIQSFHRYYLLVQKFPVSNLSLSLSLYIYIYGPCFGTRGGTHVLIHPSGPQTGTPLIVMGLVFGTHPNELDCQIRCELVLDGESFLAMGLVMIGASITVHGSCWGRSFNPLAPCPGSPRRGPHNYLW